MGGATLKPAAKHHIGTALLNRTDHQRIVLRVIFQIGILHDRDCTDSGRKTCGQGRSLALILGMEENREVVRLQALEQLPGAVAGAVIDHDDLLGGHRRPPHPLHQGRNRGDFVVTRNHHRQQGPAAGQGARLSDSSGRRLGNGSGPWGLVCRLRSCAHHCLVHAASTYSEALPHPRSRVRP